MPHKFEPKNISRLEYPERFTEEHFAEILKILPVDKYSSILELGCGSGFYTFSLAQHSPPNARVFALDIEAQMLDFLRANMRGGKIVKPQDPEDVKKIIPLLIKENEFEVLDASIDLFFCAKVFHEIDRLPVFFEELERVLKKNGTIFILDWKKEPMERGPPLEHRVDVGDAINSLKENNFQIDASGEIFTYYWYIMGKYLGEK